MGEEAFKEPNLGRWISMFNRNKIGEALTCQAKGRFFKLRSAKTRAIIFHKPDRPDRPSRLRSALKSKRSAIGKRR